MGFILIEAMRGHEVGEIGAIHPAGYVMPRGDGQYSLLSSLKPSVL